MKECEEEKREILKAFLHKGRWVPENDSGDISGAEN